MNVMLIGEAPEVEAQLSGARVIAANVFVAKPDEMPTSMLDLTSLLGGRSLPDVLILAPGGEDPRQTLPFARILPVEQHVGVVIVLNSMDAEFAIDALRNGVSDVISAEPSLEELRSALSRAGLVSQRAAQPSPALNVTTLSGPTEQGVVIVVGSAAGGVGKTFAAVNLAVGLAGTSPGSCCIVDAATQFGGVAHQLDVVPQFSMPDIVAAPNPIAAKSYLTSHSSGLFVAPASENPGDLDEVEPTRIAETIEMLAGQFKTVIVDTEPGLTPVTLEILMRADELLVVSDFSVHSIRATSEYLKCVRLLPRHIPLTVKLLLNREDPAFGIRQKAAEETIGMEADLVLKNQPQITLAGNQGIPPMLAGVRDKLRRDISPLVGLFHPHDDPRRVAGRWAS